VTRSSRHFQAHRNHFEISFPPTFFYDDALENPKLRGGQLTFRCPYCQAVAAALGGPALASIILRMLKEAALDGLPDLLCLRARRRSSGDLLTKMEFDELVGEEAKWTSVVVTRLATDADIAFEAQLVEVKSPRDKLQDHQKLWLRHFRSVGLAASVMRVQIDGEPPPKKKRRPEAGDHD